MKAKAAAASRTAADLPAGLDEALAGQWAAACSCAVGAKDGLAAFLRLHLDFLAAEPGTGEILYGGPPDDETGSFDTAVRETLKPTLAALAAAIERGKSEKAFRSDIDPEMAAVHFLGIMQMSFVYWMIGDGQGSLQGLGEQLLGQFLASISA
ncbi:MAG: hypothetical protein NTZ26_12725 [Candidatus Aminicenantes bacterium]|nr:hypothetical protein [Candidatus Aminicenantes bacterium]